MKFSIDYVKVLNSIEVHSRMYYEAKFFSFFCRSYIKLWLENFFKVEQLWENMIQNTSLDGFIHQ